MNAFAREQPATRRGSLPHKLEIIRTPSQDSKKPLPPSDKKQTAKSQDTWRKNRVEIDSWVRRRKRLYRMFVEATLVLVLVALWFANYPPALPFPGADEPTGFNPITSLLLNLANWLSFVLPDFLQPFIAYIFVVRPSALGVLLLLIGWFVFSKVKYRKGYHRACEAARLDYLDSIQGWTVSRQKYLQMRGQKYLQMA